MSLIEDKATQTFEPKVVAYCCTYCAYTAGDLAGSMRLEYAPNVRVVKILCTGKVDAILLLRALEDGADAVYVAGCALGFGNLVEADGTVVDFALQEQHFSESGLEHGKHSGDLFLA